MYTKKIVMFIAVLITTYIAAVVTSFRSPTVRELIADYTGEPGKSGDEQSAEARRKRQYAEGYLAGVADGSQGKSWCDDRLIKTGTAEISPNVMRVLQRLPPDEQDQLAAPVIVYILAMRFPCKT